ncbi:MAG: 2-amino-4-hydroxy-6-hydroxymethyldihydropteridine diphosphokinase [Ornithinimicrobium sp.]
MDDQIELRGVRGFGRHGVLDSERRQGQEFIVDLTLSVDTRQAAATDDVSATVNYANVAADAAAVIAGPAVNLIETLAAMIAERVLTAYPSVASLVVTVHKPHAPVGVPFDDVLVRLERRRDVAVTIALGANLGEADASVRSAVAAVNGLPGVWGVRASGLYRTAPVGGPAQQDYVNAVMTARTSMDPRTLLAGLHSIERAFGRDRTVRWGPRTLDLDLIQYGNPQTGSEVVCSDPDLQLPHPRARVRGFVLVPWLEVDPNASMTTAGEVGRVDTLLRDVDTADVRLIEESGRPGDDDAADGMGDTDG